jgi:hypothetical protein
MDQGRVVTVCGVGVEDDDVGGGALDGVPQGRGAVGRFVRDAEAVQVGLVRVHLALIIESHDRYSTDRIIT